MPQQTNMPLNTNSQNEKQNLKDRIRSAMNARLFIYATMVMAQVLGSMFGFGSVTVNDLLSIPAAHAAEGISHTINYQGKLMDSAGNLVADGNYDMEFTIYDAATSGIQLWTATSSVGIPTGAATTTSVEVTSGLFSILLGDADNNQLAFPDSLFNNDTLYLGVTIGTDGEMEPRKRLSAVPYSYNSEMLQGQYASSSSLGSDANLFALTQASSSAAYTTRTALYIETSGNDNEKDFLIRGSNDGTSDAFSVTREGNVTTTGNLQVDGATIIGSDSTDKVTFNAQVASDITPDTNNTYDLGSSAYSWNDIYASGTSYLSSIYSSPKPSQYTKVGTVSGMVDPWWIVTEGRLAYVSEQGNNLSIIDFSDPENPKELSSTYINVYLRGMAIKGEYAYIVSANTSDDFNVVDISNPSSPSLVTSINLSDNPNAVHVSGNYAYVSHATNGSAIDVIDISDPTNPSVVNTIILTGDNLSDFKIRQNYMYVTSYFNNEGVYVYDISDPINITQVDYLSLSDTYGIDIKENYLYVGRPGTADQFSVIDATDPTDLSLVKSFSVNEARSVFVNGDKLFLSRNSVGTGEDGVSVYDISSSTNPIYQGGFESDDSIIGVAFSGKYALIANWDEDSVQIYDMGGIETDSLNAHSAELGILNVRNNATFANDLSIFGHLNIGQGGIFNNGSLNVVATSTFSDISLSGRVDSDFIPYLDNNYSLGSLAYRWKNLYATNVSSTNIDALGYVSTTDLYLGGSLFTGDLQSVTDIGNTTNNSLIITSATPTHVGSVTGADKDEAIAIVVSGDYAYLTSIGTNDGLSIIDISDPTLPTQVGIIIEDGSTELLAPVAVAVQGNYAYVVAQGSDAISVVDISDPTNPTEVSSYRDATCGASCLMDAANDIYISGKYAYVISIAEKGMEIIDISDPTNLTHVGSIVDDFSTLLDDANKITVQGNYAYITNYIGGIEIIDISDPTNPTHAGALANGAGRLLDTTSDICVRGRYAYVISIDDDALEIVDISDPTNPTHAGSISDATILGEAVYLDVVGDYAYVTSLAQDTVAVIDISDATNPTLVAYTSDATCGAGCALQDPYNIFIDGNYAYIASRGEDGLEILSLTSLKAPTADIGSISTDELNVTNNAIINNDLFVQNGLNIGHGGLLSQGDVGFAGSLNVLATSTFSDINVTGRVNSNLLPYITDTYYLGNSSYRWLGLTVANVSSTNIDALGYVSTTNLFVSASTTFGGVEYYWPGADGANGEVLTTNGSGGLSWAAAGASTPSWADVTLVGATSSEWISFYGATSTGNINPGTNNAYDIGTASTSWRDIYASGTIRSKELSVLPYQDGALELITTVTFSQPGSNPFELYLRGSYLYVASAFTGTNPGDYDFNSNVIFDVSDPTAPTTTAVVKLDGGGLPSEARDVIVRGKYMYSITQNSQRVYIHDISDPGNVIAVATSTAFEGAPNPGHGIYVDGNFLYSTKQGDIGYGNVQIWDISNPHSITDDPHATMTFGTSGLQKPYVYGNHLFIPDNIGSSLHIIDITSPLNPTLTKTVTGLSAAYDVMVQDGYAYVAGTDLYIIDIKDISNAALVKTVALDGSNQWSVNVTGRYVYVGGDNRLNVVDAEDPTNAYLLDVENIGGMDIRGVQSGGQYVYTVSNDDVLKVWKIGGAEINALQAHVAEFGSADILGNLDVTSQFSVGGSANIGQHLSVNGTLGVYGTTTLNHLQMEGRVNSNLLPYITDTYYLGNSTYRWLGINVANVTTANLAADYATTTELWVDGVQITGAPPSWADVTLVGATSSEWISFYGATSTGDLRPSSTLAYDLGTTNYRWKDIWASSTISGNVGVNTDSPTGLLDVISDTTFFAGYSDDITEPGGTATASTEWSGTYPASDAFDNSYGTSDSWFSTGVAPPHWLKYDLGAGNEAAVIRYRMMYNLSWAIYEPRTWTFEGSNNDSSWDVLDTQTSIDFVNLVFQTFDFSNTTAYRYYRVNISVTSNGGAGAINELELITLAETPYSVLVDYDGNLTANASTTLSNLTLTGRVDSDMLPYITDTYYLGTSTYRWLGLNAATVTTTDLWVNGVQITGAAPSWAEVTLVGATSSEWISFYGASSTGNINPDVNNLYDLGSASNEWRNIYSTGTIYGNDVVVRRDLLNLYTDVSYGPQITTSTAGSENVVFAQGEYLYVLENNGGSSGALEVMDITNPMSPTTTGRMTFSSTLTAEYDMFVQGNYAYVVTSNLNYLYVVDISDPTNPTEVSATTLNNGGYGIFVKGRYAYVTGLTGFFQIFDLIDPENPVQVSLLTSLTSNPNAVHVQGNYAYIGGVGDQLVTIDISDPKNPVAIDTAPSVGADINDIYAYGNYVYVAANELYIYDITSSTNATLVDTVTIFGTANTLDVSGRYVYVGNSVSADDDNITIVDVLDPTSATIVHTDQLNTASIHTQDLQVVGSYLYAITESTGGVDYVTILTLPRSEIGSLTAHSAELGSLSVVGDGYVGGSFSISDSLSVGNGGIYTNGTLAVMATSTLFGNVGIGTRDPSDFKLQVAGNIGPDADVTYDIGSATYQWRNTYSEKITALPSGLDLVSTITTTGDPRNIEVQGNYLYELDGYNTLKVYDIQDTAHPKLVSSLYLAINQNTLVVSGDFAYIGGGNSAGVRVVDISDPGQPVLRSTLTTGVPAYAYDSFVSGKYLYVTYGGSADDMYIYDISDPDSVRIVGNTDTFTSADVRGVYVQGDFAYITEIGTDSMHIIDITDPTSPTVKGSIDLGSGILTDMVVNGNYAYVSDGSSIKIIDITSSTAPVSKASLALSGGANALYIANNYLYAGGGLNLYTIDVSSSTAPTVIETIGSLATIWDIEVSGRNLFASRITTTDQIRIYDVKGAYVNGLIANSAELGSLTVMDEAVFNNRAFFSGGLTVGNQGIYTNGTLSVLASTTFNGVEYFWPDADGTDGYQLTTDSNGQLSWTLGTVIPNLQEVTDAGNTTDNSMYQTFATPEYKGQIQDDYHAGGLGTAYRGAYGIAYKDHYAFITGYIDDSISVVDFSSTTNPVEIATVHNGGSILLDGPWGIDIHGDYAYISTYTGAQIEILDISDPYNPTHVGSMDQGANNFREIKYSNGHVFVVDTYSTDEIIAINVEDPTNPYQADTLSVGADDPWAIDIQGNYAYVAYAFANRIGVIDISDPTNLAQVASVTSDLYLDGVRDIAVRGNYAYAFSRDETDDYLTIIDISDPTSPTIIGWVQDAGGQFSNPSRIFVQGDYVYLSSSEDDRIAIFNITSSTNPTYVTGMNEGSPGNPPFINGDEGDLVVTESGLILYVDGGLSAFSIFEQARFVTPAADISTLNTQNFRNTHSADFEGRVSIEGPLALNGVEYLFPNADGSDGTLLKTDGDGNLSWGLPDTTLSIVGVGRENTVCDYEAPLCLAGRKRAAEMDGPKGIDVRGDYAYVASYLDDAIEIIDISDSDAATSVGRIVDAQLNEATGIFVNGNYAYVTAEDYFTIVDISDPGAPEIASSIYSITYFSDSTDIYVEGKYAYTVGEGTTDRLVAVDISDPANPVVARSLAMGGNVYGVEVQGDYAYVTVQDNNTMTIVDISDISGFQIVGTVYVNYPRGIDVVGNKAYVTSYNDDALKIIDITSSTNPVEIGSVIDNTLMNQPYDVKVSGNYAHMAIYGADRAVTIDISSSTNPVFIDDQTSGYYDGAYAIDVANGKFYMTAYLEDNLIIFDVPDYTAPAAQIGDLTATNFTVYNDTFLNDDLYVNNSALIGGDININGKLAVDGTTEFNGVEYAWPDADGSDGSVLKTDSNGNLSWGFADTLNISAVSRDDYICDNSSPYCAVSKELAEALNGARGVFVRGDYAYVTGSGDNGLQIIDVSDSDNPVPVGAYISGTYLAQASDVFVNGNYAYIAASDDFTVIDISDPETPEFVTSIANTTYFSQLRGVYVQGHYAYVVGTGDDRLVEIDIADPTAPVITRSILLTGDLYGVDVKGDYAYVTAGPGGDAMYVIDVSDHSSSMQNVGSIFVDYAVGIDVVGNTAYVTSYDADALKVIDITSSTNPVEIGSYSDATIMNTAYDVKVSGNYAHVAAYSADRMVTIDISSSTNPTYIDDQTINLYTDAHSIYVANGKVYMTAYAGDTLTIFDVPNYTAPSAQIGDLAATNFTVYNDAFFNDDVYMTNLYGFNISADDIYSTRVTSGEISAVPNAGAMTTESTTVVGSGDVRGIDVVGDFTYLSDTNSGLFSIYDTTDKNNPVSVGSLATGYTDLGTVIVRDNYAYVNAGLDFIIIDVSSSTNPTVISTIAFVTNGNPTYDLYMEGNYVYFPDYNLAQVDIIDVTDPNNPSIIKTVATPISAQTITGYGDYIYIIQEFVANDPVAVIDISDPLNAYVVDLIDTSEPSTPVDIMAVGNRLYSHDTGELAVMDTSDPTNLVVLDTHTQSAGLGDRPQSLHVAGNYAYTFAGTYLYIYDVSDSSNIVLAGQKYIGASTLWSLDVQGSYAYVVDSSRTLHIIDLGGVKAHSIEGYSAILGTMNVSGFANFSSEASVGGKLTVGQKGIYNQGTLDVLGESRFYSTSTFADIRVNGRVDSDLLPYDTLTYDLGSSAYRWKDVWASSTRIGTSTSPWEIWQASNGLTFSYNNFANRFLTIANNGTILSGANNTQDIGSYTNQWKDIYATGTSYLEEIWSRNIDATNLVTDFITQKYLHTHSSTGYGTVVVRGSYAYVANADDFYVYNISNPDNVKYLSYTDIDTGNGNTQGLRVRGNYAYISDDDGDVTVIDISDPNAPEVVTTYVDVNRGDSSLDIAGKYLYVPYNNDLRIYDISTEFRDQYATMVNNGPDGETETTYVGSVSTGGLAPRGVQVVGSLAYVTNYTSGTLSIIDVGNPTSPTLLSTSTVVANVSSIYVNGDYVYMMAGLSTNFYITDATDPTNPSVVATLDIGMMPSFQTQQNIKVVGNYAYISGAAGSTDLLVLDVSSSTNPTIIARKDLGKTYGGSLDVSGRNVYVSEYTGFEVFDVGGIETHGLYAYSARAGNLDVETDATIGNNLDVGGSISAGAGILADGPIESIAKFEYVTTTDTSSNPTAGPYNVDVYDDMAYVVNRLDSTITVLDVTNPDEPVNVTTTYSGFALSNQLVNVVVGNYMYVYHDRSGTQFRVYDVSDPANPVVTGGLQLTGASFYGDMKIVGQYAYVAEDNVLYVIDIQDPTNPSIVATQGVGASIRGLDILGNYAYIAHQSSVSMTILDISNPHDPVYVSDAASLAVNAVDVVVKGNYAFLPNEDGPSVKVLDITDKTNPVLVNTTDFEYQGNPRIAEIQGDYLYVSDDIASNAAGARDRVWVYNVSDPENTYRVRGLKPYDDNTPRGIKVYKGYLYTAIYGHGTGGYGDDPTNKLGIYKLPGFKGMYVDADGGEFGRLVVEQEMTIGNHLSIHGGLEVGPNGILTNGGLSVQATSTFQDIEVNGWVNSDLIPMLDDTYWLGTSTHRWKGLNAVSVSTTNLTINGVVFNGLQASGVDNRIVRMDGTDQIQDSDIVLDDSGDVYPVNNNSQELGLTTNRWSDVWGATVHVGTSTYDITQTVNGNFNVSKTGINFIDIGTTNSTLGAGALAALTTGVNNTAIGGAAMNDFSTGDDNTAIGYQALWGGTVLGNSTGSYNTGIGSKALRSLSTGYRNVAVGNEALTANTDGYYNTALGDRSMKSNTSGFNNIAIGAWSLNGNLGGFDNIAVGYASLVANTEGTQNTAIGNNSMYNNDTGTANTAIGMYSLHDNLTGSSSTAMGFRSLYHNISGEWNTAAGYDSLYTNSTGNFNTAFGSWALQSNTTASMNTAIGFGSLWKNATGTYNTAIGASTIVWNTNGIHNTALGNSAMNGDEGNSGFSYNTAIGSRSLYNLESGASNTAVGFESLFNNTAGNFNTGIGVSSLNSNTTGYGNSAVGFAALYNNTSGAGNIGIGLSALYSVTSSNSNIAIGSNSLYSNTAMGNLAIGISSLNKNTAGIQNVGMGSTALYGNETGIGNTAIGFSALYGNGGTNSHSYNTAVGSNSMYAITTGASNTAMGADSLRTNTSGILNTAIGAGALSKNTTSTNNSALGAYALWNNTGRSNSAFGSLALAGNTWGEGNSAFGSSALANNLTGANNVAIGRSSMYFNSSGANNVTIGEGAGYNGNFSGAVAIGQDALRGAPGSVNNFSVAIGRQSQFSGITSSYNVSAGYNSMFSITHGDDNVALGSNSMYSNSSGLKNIAIGSNALYYNTSTNDQIAIGYKALENTTTTGQNIAIGRYAMRNKISGSGNVALGLDAMQNSVSGGNNIAIGNGAFSAGSNNYAIGIGFSALSNNTAEGSIGIGLDAGAYNTGDYFTAVGHRAGRSNTSGDWNTIMGYDAAYSNTLGGVNTAVGAHALYYNVSGGYNTAMGQGALWGTTGDYNTAVGVHSGFRLTTGDYNTSLGYRAFYTASSTGSYNTALGTLTLEDNTSGYNNVAVGAVALANNTQGFSNTAIGFQASQYNLTGDYNTAVGQNALQGVSGNNHNYNSAVGYNAGSSITTGSGNTTMGYQALDANATSWYNTAVGYQALDSVTGGLNTAIGDIAGATITTGANNTFVGAQTDGPAGTLTNSTAIGYQAAVTSSNSIRIGNSSVSSIGGYAPWSNLSDERLKDNIADNDLGLEFIDALRPRHFTYTAKPTDGTKDGFIAQEIKQVMDDQGVTFGGLDTHDYDNGGYYFLNYSAFTVPLVNAVQELHASSSPLFNGITIDPSFVALEESFMQVDLDGNVAYKGVSITSKGTASSSTQAFDSYTFSFKGSAWNSSTTQDITTSFDIHNNTIHASSSELKFVFSTGTGFTQDLLTISNAGDVHVSNDLHVGGRLFLGSKSTGEASTSTYIFVDDTMAPTSTYIATNADGWQTETTYDYAERYESTQKLVPGDLVTADSSGTNLVKRATSPTEPLLGIVSTKPGFVTGRHYEGWHPVALAGRVPTRVSTMNGAITAGDYIAASEVPGVGVKATGAGNVVGIALESYDGAEEGLISVFVKPSFSMGSISTSGETAGTIVTQPQQTNVERVEIEGLAMILAGSTEVHISYGTVLHYSMVYATPHASVDNGTWWISNRTDKGFDINLSQPQTHDTEFTWMSRPMNAGTIRFVSDNTYHPVDDLTGQPIGPTIDELIIPTSTDLGIPTSTDPGTSTSTEPVATVSEPATSSTTMVSSTDTLETDAAASSTWPVTGGDAATSTTQNGV